MVHLTASRVNDTTTKVVQPEIVFSSKSESSNTHSERERPNSISVGERGKATMAFSFTDSPQNEYGIISGGLNFLPSFLSILLMSFFLFFSNFSSHQTESSSCHKCHNPGFHNLTCISLKCSSIVKYYHNCDTN